MHTIGLAHNQRTIKCNDGQIDLSIDLTIEKQAKFFCVIHGACSTTTASLEKGTFLISFSTVPQNQLNWRFIFSKIENNCHSICILFGYIVPHNFLARFVNVNVMYSYGFDRTFINKKGNDDSKMVNYISVELLSNQKKNSFLFKFLVLLHNFAASGARVLR